jgi:protocatechuate 3,4-dioxygenase beta subunit
VQAEAPEHVTGSLENVSVTAGETTRGVIVRLARGQVIEGVVEDETGRRLSGAKVYVWTQDDPAMPWAARNLETDRDGRFRADSLAHGEYRIRVTLAGRPPEVVKDVRSGTKGLRITLRQGRTITGRVVGPDDRPVAGVRVHAMREGSIQSAVSKRDGTFEIRGLEGGEYRVNASPRGKVGLRGTVREGVPAGSTGLVLRLAVGLTITGTVVDESGRPVAGAFVFASGTNARGEQRPAPSNAARTDEAGRFTITGVDEGSYDISVSVPNRRQTMRVIARGGSRRIRLVLEPGDPVPPPVEEAPPDPVPEPVPEGDGD